MDSRIEELVQENPPLTDVLRFYEKALRFYDAVRGIVQLQGQARSSYPQGVLDALFERFSSITELPEGHLVPLKQAMELGEIDFSRLPLGEEPAFSLPYPEDDLSTLLFLMSKPYFNALRNARPMDNESWHEGRCPLCGGFPSLSWFECGGHWIVFCVYCGTSGYGIRSGCQICGIIDDTKQHTRIYQPDDGIKIATCDLCRSYVKILDADMFSRITPELADLISIPLDIMVQERGYVRRSPNPLGMKKMSSRG